MLPKETRNSTNKNKSHPVAAKRVGVKQITYTANKVAV